MEVFQVFSVVYRYHLLFGTAQLDVNSFLSAKILMGYGVPDEAHLVDRFDAVDLTQAVLNLSITTLSSLLQVVGDLGAVGANLDVLVVLAVARVVDTVER